MAGETESGIGSLGDPQGWSQASFYIISLNRVHHLQNRYVQGTQLSLLSPREPRKKIPQNKEGREGQPPEMKDQAEPRIHVADGGDGGSRANEDSEDTEVASRTVQACRWSSQQPFRRQAEG